MIWTMRGGSKKLSIVLDPVSFVYGIKDCSVEGVLVRNQKDDKVLYKDKNGKHRTGGVNREI